jgi:hypothetical protein
MNKRYGTICSYPADGLLKATALLHAARGER